MKKDQNNFIISDTLRNQAVERLIRNSKFNPNDEELFTVEVLEIREYTQVRKPYVSEGFLPIPAKVNIRKLKEADYSFEGERKGGFKYPDCKDIDPNTGKPRLKVFLPGEQLIVPKSVMERMIQSGLCKCVGELPKREQAQYEGL